MTPGGRPLAYVVGVGPGAPELVTSQAMRCLAQCRLVLSWDLNLEPVRNLIAGKTLFIQKVDNYVNVAEAAFDAARANGEPLAVVRIGDPCVSSGLAGLLDMAHTKGFDVRVVPGLSSVQVAAAHAGIELHRAVVVSFHDDDRRNDLEAQFLLAAWQSMRHLILLAGPTFPPEQAANYLITRGLASSVRSAVGSRLTFPDELWWNGTLQQMRQRSFEWLSVTIVTHPAEGGFRGVLV
jgi:cobalt-precorrin-7 (C5)-methyltransferase